MSEIKESIKHIEEDISAMEEELEYYEIAFLEFAQELKDRIANRVKQLEYFRDCQRAEDENC